MTDSAKAEAEVGVRAALEAARRIVSDRAAGGRMLTSKEEATEVFRQITAALANLPAKTDTIDEPKVRISVGEIDNLLSRLDQGAAYQGYPEGFGFSWTRLAADAATVIRWLRSSVALPAKTERAAVVEDEAELQGCEHCDNAFDIERMTMNGDVWLCPACLIEWDKTFDACQHEWEPGHHDGDTGQFCPKCTGFVEQSDFEVIRALVPPLGEG